MFTVSFEKSSLSIRGQQETTSDLENYELTVRDNAGRLLDTMLCTASQSSFQDLKQTYEFARRKALNVNQALDDLLRQLQ